jgi:hypothetical protein
MRFKFSWRYLDAILGFLLQVSFVTIETIEGSFMFAGKSAIYSK